MQELTINLQASLRDAMHCIDTSPQKICIVIDADGTIIRSVTDGDLRRALLAGETLDSAITVLPAQPPIAVPTTTPRDEILRLMRQHKVATILILEDDGALKEVVDRNDLEDKILLSPPHMGDTEMEFIQRAMDDNWIAPAGPNLVKFEADLARMTTRKHALALSSGSAALHLALRVLNVGSGDRVYVSDLTFIASLQPVFYQNATPVLIDADPKHWNMSVPALERQLAKDKLAGTLPSAIMVVHLYGQSADMNDIMALANAYGIPVIEDAAESLGASYNNHPSGAHGDLAVYSFNGNKIITTSGGGALVADREDLIDHARKLSTQGRDTAEHYQHSEVAYNYRMSNILAGIGIGQLAVLAQRVQRRREIFDIYTRELNDIDGLSFQENSKNSAGNRWLSVMTLDPDKIPYHPYLFMRRLREVGVETRPAWKPMHMQPICHGLEFAPHTETEAVSSSLFLRSLCLPSGSSMADDDVKRVANAIRTVLKEG
ncbi:MAG: DegT/DnrJ/EryC1/StrS family aminotransferase [Halocynthiibacter sp.]